MVFDYRTFDVRERLREIGMFFDKTDRVHQALRRLVRRLKKAGISYAIMGAMAVNLHGARRTTDVRCVVLSQAVPVEVQVVHGPDVVLSEVFQEEWMAMKWARAYRDRLRAQGWQDVSGS